LPQRVFAQERRLWISIGAHCSPSPQVVAPCNLARVRAPVASLHEAFR
jgi:hypothetical protein